MAEDRRGVTIRLTVLQYVDHRACSGAGGQLLGAAGRRSTRSSRRWPRTTTSGRWRCARRAAWCSTATAACWSRTATPTASRSSASTPRISNRTVRLLAPVLGIDEARVREIVDRHRREPTLPADHDRAGRDAGAGRGGHGAPARLRAAGRRRRAGADAAVSGDDGRASVRLRRRGQRRAGRRRRRPEERRHRRPVGHREGLQRAADGRGRRQARRRQQRRARDPDARRRCSRPKASGCS